MSPTAEIGLLHEATLAIERPPRANLAASLELAGAEQAAVLAEELPGAVHLTVEVRSAEPELTVVVVIDRRDGFGGIHIGRVAREGRR
jgi:hypothetical protein